MKYEQEIINAIKSKNELASLNDSFVKEQVHIVLQEQKIPLNCDDVYSSFSQFSRSAFYKKILSLTRKRLRIAYGVYIKNPLSSLKKILSSLSSFDDPNISLILESHQSSQERLLAYPFIYENIFSCLSKLDFPKSYSLLDVACGYNPFAYKFLPIKPQNYFAVDLSFLDAQFINSFFFQTNISGKAFAYSILSPEFLTWFKEQTSTLTFFLKTFDSVEQIKKNYSKTLLLACPSKYIVASFPLVSISKKHVLGEGLRAWFTRFVEQQKWDLLSFSLSDEVFYIIKK